LLPTQCPMHLHDVCYLESPKNDGEGVAMSFVATKGCCRAALAFKTRSANSLAALGPSESLGKVCDPSSFEKACRLPLKGMSHPPKLIMSIARGSCRGLWMRRAERTAADSWIFMDIHEFLEKYNFVVKNQLYRENPDFNRHTDGGFYVFLRDPSLALNS
jgi:hypothetical protein